MASTRPPQGDAYRKVLSFIFARWRQQPWRVAAMFGLFMLDKVLIYLPSSLATVFEYISVDYHFSNIARGVIDTRDLIYYGSAVTFLLLVGTAVLQKRRWS